MGVFVFPLAAAPIALASALAAALPWETEPALLFAFAVLAIGGGVGLIAVGRHGPPLPETKRRPHAEQPDAEQTADARRDQLT